ncbi:LacI family DNA-binding transcriptional regulator [Xanthomonas rydalmerensis]|uniref:LacI family DNA-binding transcriptional regulator n=1 Tax=Xanthomonas rydalmerensis TaxID=3046274 RepID=A0ABZ0JNI2_9XANT|nr:LacI family DNA-binding transcriptional regulator [Xanthomonas sp. DM-2023]WOS41378.1 LacI family DNA-binding transcriptional regulator [Xanthomonas sp. DM-2023]WOS45563.1 LacI family DNA-binding transcriptional regulator [Xanthomonas sp. DM-2023]WOS49742.1 LacI family DNA-binding transcriptional regulator [Xanthomonas sp. DM-2023]WOS53922.1 LacI family DNA-binding transcriptional regulator [Xanthomonas sp. DM-2023]WOS58105.1 LacI family DNA-binding transcriptional regulator [Xanthomonas sp
MDKPKKSVRRKTSGVTIDEVAALAGVSPMTVSRAINQGKVRDATRERVMRAVRELGYTPNLAASSLAAAQHTRIALIYTNPSGAYLRELLVGLLRVASNAAIQLVIHYWEDLDADAERKAARALSGRVDGVILPPPLCESQAAVTELVKAGIPVVAIAAGRLSDAISCVRIDDFHAGREMAEHLIQHGHRRIGFIRGRQDLSASAQRYEGFVTALQEAGLKVEPGLVQQGDYTYRSGLAAAEKLLSHRRPPTAIFASNDDMGAAAISVAHRRGLEVPRDLSVVGFDDTSAATTVWPELTTIHQPIASMADAAIDILLRSIRRKRDDARMSSDHVVPHRLVLRGSVASPPKGR